MTKFVRWFLIVILVLVSGAGLLYNRLWAISTAVLLAIPVVGFLAARKSVRRKVLFFLLPFGIVLLLGSIGKWPVRPYQMPYGTSGFSFLRNASANALYRGADRMPSAPVEDRTRVQQRVFDELSHLNGVGRAGTEVNRIRELAAVLPTLSWFRGDLSKLKAALSEVESCLTGMPNLKALSSQESNFRVFLEASIDSVRAIPDGALRVSKTTSISGSDNSRYGS